MYRSKIILSGNIGLGFSRKSDSHTQNNRSETYQKIHDTLKYVFNKYDEKKPAVLAIQELGNLELTLRPFFENPPLATDIKTLQKLGDGGRGVGIYSRSPEAVQLDTESEDDEIAAIIEPYVNPKGHKKKVCIINVYRLTNKDHERSISDTTDRNIVEIATEERTFKPDTADQIIFREIERAENDLKSAKKPEKTFFKLGQNCTKGIMEKDDTKPHIDKLAEKHNKKLASIKKADIERGREAIHKIYGKRQKLTARWAGNIRDFRRAVMSTSNSNAKDCAGLSLVVTKAFLSNTTFLRRYKLICDWSLKLGYFQNCGVKISYISFTKIKGTEQTLEILDRSPLHRHWVNI